MKTKKLQKKPEVSIVVAHMNGKEIIKEFLDSLKKQTFKDFETIIVDNGSTDGSISFIKKKYPWVKLIRNEENRGFSGGNNDGMHIARGDYILLLNNDTVLDKDFIKNLFNERNSGGILGAKNYYHDVDGRKDIIWAVGSKLNKIFMKSRLFGNKEIDYGQYNQKIELNETVGSAMFINRKVLDEIGLFDERYFNYCEETELQLRAKKAGFRIVYVPAAVLWHKVGYTTGGGSTPLATYYLVRNRGLLIRQHQKWFLKPISYFSLFLEVILRSMKYSREKRKDKVRATWAGYSDFLNKKFGKTNRKF